MKCLRPLLEASGDEWQGRNFPAGGRLGRSVFMERVLPAVPKLCGGGVLVGLVQRGNVLAAQVDFGGTPVSARVDSIDRALQTPPERRNYPACCQSCPRLPVCEAGDPSMTPALAWRKLGLIEPDGTPTRRGTIFGFFNHGEGLAVAAALEEPDYPIEQLIYDLANLRAGHRFAAESDSPYGGRLGGPLPASLRAGGLPWLPRDGGAGRLWRRRGRGGRIADPQPRRAGTGCSPIPCGRETWSGRSPSGAASLPTWPRHRITPGSGGASFARRPADTSRADLPGLCPFFPPLLPAQQRRYQHRLFMKE